MADRMDPKEFLVDVDSKVLKVDPTDDESLREALASAGAEFISTEPPRFVVRVTASSESEAERKAVEALERWASGLDAGWSVVGLTEWKA
jgi:hypothetical protein